MSESFCFTSNLSYYLRLRGVVLAPEMIFGLAECIGTTYNCDPAYRFEIINGRKGSYEDMLKCLSLACGIQFICREEDINSPDELLMLIYEKDIRLLEIDDYFLEYHPFFHKYHYKRLAVYSTTEKDKVGIFDDGIKVIDKRLFFMATGKRAKWLEVINNEINVCEEKVLKSVYNICLVNLGYRCYNSIHVGYEGVRIFFESACSNALKLNSQQYNAFMRDLFFQMNRPGGLANSRHLFSNFLNLVAHMCEFGELIDFADLFAQIAIKWKTCGNLFYKGVFNDNREYITHIYNHINQVIEYERNIFTELLHLINKSGKLKL